MSGNFKLLRVIVYAVIINSILGDASIGGTPAEQKVVLSDCVKSQIEFFSKKDRGIREKDKNNVVPLYRYLRLNHGDHFYTITDYNQTLDGHQYEGVVGLVFKSPRTGTAALHRYFNVGLGDHFYTTSWNEIKGGQHGYSYEGIECYVFEKPMDGTKPLFRYWNGRDHFYTINWSELRADSLGWGLEGIQAYIYPPKLTYYPLTTMVNSLLRKG